MKLKISTYWKCQLTGWILFSTIAMAFAALNEPMDELLIIALPSCILLTILGIFSSHLMKRLIKRLRVLQKSIKQQVLYMFLITGLFSVLLTVGFNFIVHPSGAATFLSEVIKLNSFYLTIFFFHGIFFSAALLIWNLIYFIFHYIQKVKKGEQLRFSNEKELLEFEARALRAQMNPHFIFNSLNSIKSLINKDEKDKAATYLTTFSKLIRTLFNNSDRREVSLYEELETCKLYTLLEKMRFDNKVGFVFDVDETIDLKDFKVPALILQPFIENAIWHGLMPKETGGKIIISVKKVEGTIQCIIEDDGIGRELSIKNKPKYEVHQSKGIGLTKSRLELDKLLNEREDKIFIIDKEDEKGIPEGTKIIISFKEK